MIIVIKLIIATIIWFIVHKICRDYPFDNYGQNLEPYDYFSTYATIYMVAFLIIIVLFSLF